ncbi:MAG: hypothetical protein ISS63_13180 [Desulfobacteraceae bacterium]|nr:hypothetical protein [Desulfobacteraceae bacterium]
MNYRFVVNWLHYDRNPEFEPSVLPNGTVVNFTDWNRVMPLLRIGPGSKDAARSITDGVWMFDGKFYAPVVIETEEGLLVFSTGENAEEGKMYRKLIREQISDKSIIGLFYDHAHYPYGASTLLDGDKAVIVAHPDHNRIIRESGHLANPVIPEMLPHLDGRADIHFGSNHPKQGPDAVIAATALDLGKEQAWLPATHTLEHGEFITIGGVKIQAFHAVTDTEDSLTFWLPEKKIVIDNVLWPTIPNIYTLRGDRYRPPGLWIKALKDIRDLNAEIELCVGGGSKALHGADSVREAVTAIIDTLSFIYDQTIRLTNLGIPPHELAHHIEVPAELGQHPYVNQVYGQFEHYLPRITGWSHGWFSGRAEDMHQLPQAVYAENLINLAGGEEAVMNACEEAMGKGEYLWAKDLAVNLYYTDQAKPEYRKALADVFRKLGQYSFGTIARNFYTASALSLEGNERFTLGSVQKVDWIKEDYARAIDQLRTRINPELAAGSEGVLQFDVDGAVAALHIRNSIAEFVPDPNSHYRAADARIGVSGDDFTAYFRGELSADKMLKKAKTSGDAAKLLNMFDAFKHIPMYPEQPVL